MTEIIIDKPANAEPFDYAALDAAARQTVELATGGIRDRVGRAMADIVEIGQRLLVVKATLPRGEFGRWLASEFGWTDRTAQKLMSVARAFPNPNLGSDLMVTAKALYLLADPNVEPEAREEAVERAKGGERITPAKAAEIVTKAAEAKGKTSPVKVTAKRATAEPPTDESADFTDDDIPFDASPTPNPNRGSDSPAADPEPAGPKAVAPANEWDDYNTALTAKAKEVEAFARSIAELAGFDAKGQANVPYADGLLTFEGTVGVLRSVKRTLLENRVAGKRGNRFITEREASMTAAVANARKVSA